MKKLRFITAIIMVLVLVMSFSAPCVLADETSEAESREASEAEESSSPAEESPEESVIEESSEEPSEESSEESSEEQKKKYTVTINNVSGGGYTISDNYIGESHDRLAGTSSYTFFEGDTVTFTFTPDKGKVLKKFKANEKELEIKENTVSFVVESDVKVTYEFGAASSHHITLSTKYLCDSEGFSFALDGEPLPDTILGKYFKIYDGVGAVLTVSNAINPVFGVKKAELKIDGSLVSCEINGNDVIIPPISDNAVLYVEISGSLFSINIVQTEHGTVYASKSSAEENEEVIFTFVPEDGYKANYIVINTEAIPVTGNTYSAVAISDMTVSAVFGEDDQGSVVTLEIEKDEAGEAHGTAVIEGMSETTYVASQGETVTVFAVPDKGYEINMIKVNGISYPFTEEGKLSIVITKDTTISVSFKIIQPRITAVVTNAGGGTITAVGKTITMNYVYVNYGESITFKFTPDMNYQISFVKVDLTTVYNASDGGTAKNSYTFDNVTENHTIAVSFSPVGQLLTEFTITSTASEHGTITPIGEQKVVQGDSVSYKVTPDEGYEVDYVTVDGKDVSLRNGTYTFESVSADHIISAYFKEKTKTDTTLIGVDDIDWTTSSIVIDLTKKTEVENAVIQKLVSECVGRTVVFKSNDYEVSFVVPASLSSDQLRLDLASSKDEACANYLTVSAIIQSKAKYTDSVFTMINLNRLFPSGATARVNLGSGFAGKIVSYFTYEANELVPNTAGDIVCGEDGWAEVTLKNYKDLVFIADKVVEMTFNVTITAFANGKVDPSGTFTVNNGEKVQFTVTPDEGYAISKILVNGESVPISGTKYAITPVEDTEIEVRFVLVQEDGSSNAGLIICIIIIVVAIIGGAVLFIIKWKQTKY